MDATATVGVPVPPPQQGHPSAWTTGLCNCGEDCSSCCLTCCCPCIAFGQIAEILDNGSTSCAVSGVVYYLLMHVACTPCYSCFYRKKLRAKFNLEEDPCGDCVVHCFCEPCALLGSGSRVGSKYGKDASNSGRHCHDSTAGGSRHVEMIEKILMFWAAGAIILLAMFYLVTCFVSVVI